MKKTFALGLALLMLVAAFAGCSTKESAKANGVFRDSIAAAATTLYLPTTANTEPGTIATPCLTVLYRYMLNEAGDGYINVPMLADGEPIKMDKEGKVWQVKIKHGYKWADYGPTKGAPEMNADTVIYTFKATLDPVLLHLKANLLTNNSYSRIVNALEYQQQNLLGVEVPWEDVGIKKIDDYTVQFEMVTAVAADYFKDIISGSYTAAMVYEPLYEACRSADGANTSYGTSIDKWASSGEFILTEWVDDSKYVLTRNPDYVYADKIKIEKLEYYVVPDSNTALQMFQNGQLDKVSLKYQQWPDYAEDPRVKEYYDDSVTYLFINNGNPKYNNMLGNLNFRKAIYYGLDRVEFARTLEGAPCTRLYRRAVLADMFTGESILNVPVDWADDPYTVFDLAKANQFLDKAFEECKATNVTFEAYYNESGTHTRASTEIFQAQINRNLEGVTITTRAVPSEQAYSLRRWNASNPTAFDLNLGSILPSNQPIDTAKFYESAYSPPRFCWTSDNLFKEKSAEIDAKYNEAKSYLANNDQEKVTECCLEIERILVKDLYVCTPIYELTAKVLFADNIQLATKDDMYVLNFGFGERYLSIK